MAPDTSPEVDVANAGIAMVEISSARIKKIKKEINKRALNQYLQLTYIPAPLSIFEGVYKIKTNVNSNPLYCLIGIFACMAEHMFLCSRFFHL